MPTSSVFVKIIKCDNGGAWYFGLEGHIFECLPLWGNYVLKEDYQHDGAWRHISKDDCQVVESVN